MHYFKNLSKRGISLALALVMCLSLLPTTAFAAGESECNHRNNKTIYMGGLSWVKYCLDCGAGERWAGGPWTEAGGACEWCGHFYGDYVSDGNATCTTDGTETRTCQFHPDVKDTQVVPNSRTSHNLVKQSSTPVTCTTDGNDEYYKCGTCGAMFSDSEGKSPITTVPTIPANGHVSGCEDSWVVNEDGTHSKVYSICGAVLDGSTHDADWTDGDCQTDKACQFEGCDLTNGKGGHNFGDYMSNNDATCTADGTMTATCGVCGETNTITAEGTMTEHSFTGGNCGTKATCSVCNAVGETDPDTHVGDTTWKLEDGKHVEYCNTCELPTGKEHPAPAGVCTGDTKCECGLTIEAIGHDLEKVPYKAPECQVSGNKEHWKCNVCNQLFADAEGTIPTTADEVKIQNLGHDWLPELAYDENGHWRACSRCDIHGTPTTTSLKNHDFVGQGVAVEWDADYDEFKSVTITCKCKYCGYEIGPTTYEKTTGITANPRVTITTNTYVATPGCVNKSSRHYGVKVSVDKKIIFDGSSPTYSSELLPHTLGEPTWDWRVDADGKVTAEAVFACTECKTNREWVEAAESLGNLVVTDSTPAACIEGGSVTYTATVTVEGKEYTSTKTYDVPANGHDLEKVPYKAPECQVSGNKEHWKCNVCNQLFADAEGTIPTTADEVKIQNLGHDWLPELAYDENGHWRACSRCDIHGTPTNTSKEHYFVEQGVAEAWDADYDEFRSVTVVTKCKYCDYTLGPITYTKGDSELSITTNTYVATPGCVNKSSRTYRVTISVKVNPNDKKAKVIFRQTLPTTYYSELLPHTLGEPTWDWRVDADGKVTAEAVFACTECKTNREWVEAAESLGNLVVTDSTPAACIEDGSVTYTATVTVEGKEYTSTKTYDVPANGHTEGEVVVENIVDPTCTEDGSYDNVTYCDVCGEQLSRETVTVEATGHNFSEWVQYELPTETTRGQDMRFCHNCGLIEYQISDTTEIEIDEPDTPLADMPIDLDPLDQLTRGTLAFILYWHEGSPETALSSYPDVSADAIYAEAIGWVEANDIIYGYENGNFGPEDAVTYEQLVEILTLYVQYLGVDYTVEIDGAPKAVVIWAEAEVILNDLFEVVDAMKA